MGSSIALTLWAFLGMESAAQNSAAVENPKRDVPLACMFGTLGAAVIYILSTTVIQGIVPNAELAKSTGPFAWPMRRCSTRPSAPSSWRSRPWPASARCSAGSSRSRRPESRPPTERMFPAFFAKVNRMGRAGHRDDRPGRRAVAAGAVDHLAHPERAVRRAGQPRRGHQRAALHHLAVGADGDDESTPRSNAASYLRNMVVALVAMLYSTYALYASGHGGGHGRHAGDGHRFIVWGFIAPRFTATGDDCRARTAGGRNA